MGLTWIDSGVRDFGHQAGIRDLQPSMAGTLQLRLDSGAQFFLETVHDPAGDFALLYLARPVGHGLGCALRVALRQAHHAGISSYMPMVGSLGSGADAQLVAGIRQTERQFTGHSLGHALDFLVRWTDEACGGPSR